MAKSLGIVLFRNDLRLHDNPVLTAVLQQCTTLLPVFIMDPRFVGDNQTTPAKTWHFQFPRCDGLKRRFLLESLYDLKTNLQGKKSDLVIFHGDPLDVLKTHLLPVYKSPTKYKVRLFMSAEYTYEENLLVAQLKTKLKEVDLTIVHTSTMVPPHKLPCSIQKLPDVYSQFRTLIEKTRKLDPSIVASPTAALPAQLPPLPEVLPPPQDFQNIWDELDTLPVQPANSAFPWKGGETAALRRMEYYFSSGKVRTYKSTRNGLVGLDYSTKFSPWLALGCLSARQIIHDLTKYEEATGGGNESTYWVWFELLWRDYLKFAAMKYGTKLFLEGGIYGKKIQWSSDLDHFQKWCEGKTGVPFVDANMRELALTGWMSNRGRQNVASFLVKDLKIDWRRGAEWFEAHLLDHDPASNYGNWLYVAGLGNDPKEDRYFNMIKQAKDYDPYGEYVLQWLPEVAAALGEDISLLHTPWLMEGSSYYPPIVMGKGWATHSARKSGSEGRNKSHGNKSEKSKGYRSGRKGFSTKGRGDEQPQRRQQSITAFFPPSEVVGK